MSCRVYLRLDGHCVETAARGEFKRLLDRYFSVPDEAEDMEECLELLREFIEKSDFPTLRSSDERLSGAVACTVTVYRDESGEPSIMIG